MKNEGRFARELTGLLKDQEKLELANEYLDLLTDSLRKGYGEKRIKREVGKGPIMFEGALEVAKSRLNVSNKYSRWNRLWLDVYSASYSTPETIASYRASRLAHSKLIDVGCGAGMQSAFFSRTCSVTAIEISPLRSIMAKLNGNVYGHGPDRIINTDYTNVIDNVDIDNDTIIFSDPLRPRSETERSLTSLIPSPLVLRKLVSKRTERFVFDLPPQMSWDNITLDGEKEYISLDGALNRLTLYQGDLARSECSAVMLPDNVRITGSPSDDTIPDASIQGKFLFVPDVSLSYARLLYLVRSLGDFSVFSREKRRTILTSDDPLDFYFPGESFNIIGESDGSGLIDMLKSLNGGKTILRFSVAPEEYYGIRNKIEDELTGERNLYLFKKDDNYLICEKDFANSEKRLNEDFMERIVTV